MTTLVEQFREALRQRFVEATEAGKAGLVIRAGDLHREINPDLSMNRMPSICDAMYSLQAPVDKIVYAPPKGKGDNLKIAYRIPRPD